MGPIATPCGVLWTSQVRVKCAAMDVSSVCEVLERLERVLPG